MPTNRKYYIPGDRRFVCAVCGFTTYRLSEMRKGVSGKQIGLDVCPVDFDDRHPNDEKVNLRPVATLKEPS